MHFHHSTSGKVDDAGPVVHKPHFWEHTSSKPDLATQIVDAPIKTYHLYDTHNFSESDFEIRQDDGQPFLWVTTKIRLFHFPIVTIHTDCQDGPIVAACKIQRGFADFPFVVGDPRGSDPAWWPVCFKTGFTSAVWRFEAGGEGGTLARGEGLPLLRPGREEGIEPVVDAAGQSASSPSPPAPQRESRLQQQINSTTSFAGHEGRRVYYEWRRTHDKTLGGTRFSHHDYKLVDEAGRVLAVYVRTQSLFSKEVQNRLARIDWFVELGPEVELAGLIAVCGVEENIRCEDGEGA